MHCDKMHATIRVAECLRRQKTVEKKDLERRLDIVSWSCKGCETGALARAGALNDDDVEARLDALRAERGMEEIFMARKNVNRAEVVEMRDMVEQVETMTETAGGAVVEAPENGGKKQCSKCREWKDRSEFSRHKKAKDGLFWQCKACKYKTEDEWRRKSALHAADAPSAPAGQPPTGVTKARFVPGEILVEACPEHILVMDFSEHQDALEKLREVAKAELRTPAAQLMYRFIRAKIAG